MHAERMKRPNCGGAHGHQVGEVPGRRVPYDLRIQTTQDGFYSHAREFTPGILVVQPAAEQSFEHSARLTRMWCGKARSQCLFRGRDAIDTHAINSGYSEAKVRGPPASIARILVRWERPDMMKWIRFCVSLVLGATLIVPTRAQQEALWVQPPKLVFTTHTLSNGLAVILLEEHAVPMINLQVCYHVGSKDEQPGRTGFAHLFEHLMFKGSAHVGPDEHSRIIEAVGGFDNAETGDDTTYFFETFPGHYLERALWLEADRMGSLNVDEANFESEREVVKEELRVRVENEPYGYIEQDLRALALAHADQFLDSRFTLPGDDRTHLHAFVQAVSNSQLRRGFCNGIPKRALRLIDDDGDRNGQATLSSATESAVGNDLSGHAHIRVGQDDDVILRSPLALCSLAVCPRAGVNIFGYRRRTDKTKGANFRMVEQRVHNCFAAVD